MRFRPFVIPAILLFVAFGLGYLIFYPLVGRAKDNAQRSSCLTNLKQIALVAAQYSQDNDGSFPVISRGEQGWADAFQPYETTYALFHCPTIGQPAGARSSDYFLNARVANLKTSQMKFPMQTISFGEGLARGGTNSHFSEMPFDWKTDENSPGQRHLSGANYAFVDGHVKWLRPNKVSSQSPSRGDDWIATFAVR